MVVFGVIVDSALEVDHSQPKGLHAELATRPSEQAFIEGAISWMRLMV